MCMHFVVLENIKILLSLHGMVKCSFVKTCAGYSYYLNTRFEKAQERQRVCLKVK